MSMNSQHPHGGSGAASYDRDREIEEQRHREEVRYRAMQHQEDMARRDQDRDRQHLDRERERERDRDGPGADRYQATAPPRHSSAGSIPIHQPVASRISGAIHSPGGLLANHNGGAPGGPPPLGGGGGGQQQQQQQQQHSSAGIGGYGSGGGGPGSMQQAEQQQGRQVQHGGQGGAGLQHQIFAPMPHAQSGGSQAPGGDGGRGGPSSSAAAAAAAVFGGPLPQQPAQHQDGQRGGPQQQPQQQPQQTQQQAGAPFRGVTPGGHPIPSGMTQGQQPILNDALTYLDQVKVQFHDQPDVYNRFLDIMKDFKSQSIDTPGVINRVSELFAGHPNLIQGFNTFLPPGYRIECGAGNDPNTIRVTTPMGTTMQSIAGGRGTQIESASSGQHLFPERGGGGGGWQRPQRSVESPEANFSTPVQNTATLFAQAAAVQNVLPLDGPGGPQTRVQPSGTNNSNGTNPHHQPGMRGAHTPTPNSGPAPANAGVNGNSLGNGNPANMSARGPVEFNHAISYVNKIKNRFQDKPEIYKQFLEILQTYQREQKPIQDVYAQVTALFHEAPDLLESFKQFLPESAGQANKATPNRAEDGVPGASLTPQPVRDGQKMPPLGSFPAPPSATKDNKKRPRAGDKQGVNAAALLPDPNPANRLPPQTVVNGTKKMKLSHTRIGDIEPTLTPMMPEPYPPRPATSTQDEMAFFDRVKKFLGNRSSMNEFLKLCNLFSQNIIDRNTLFHRGAQFIGANPDLLGFWKLFIGFDTQDVVIDNRPAPPTEKVSLSNCRGYGPSYRLLPKRELLKRCSGRDELCNSVLNDEWASHPTWASEDSGFVAHRKNQFEEGLHRIEEERHDYDFFIEANLKCIQLLEPIAQQMLAMTPAEREQFHMPSALAGQSTSIFKRICKKLYSERGIEVVNEMYATPFDVVPVLLARMKAKDEEWRFSQREWEKVWHSQTESMYLKSLDHQGILVKTSDKKNLTAKHLIDVIKTKHEEQRRERALSGRVPQHQFVWDFSDKEVLINLLRFAMMYVLHNGQHSSQEKERILEFYEMFMPAFFDIPEEDIADRLPGMPLESGEEEVDDQTPAELTNGRSRRHGRKGDLLRGVLDPGRNGSKPRTQKEDSVPTGSKETTPDVTSANEEDMADAEDTSVPDVSNERWMPSVPKPVIVGGDSNGLLDAEGDLKADGLFHRKWYNFFSNQTTFVFLSIVRQLYTRLVNIKESREQVLHEIGRLNRDKPARDIGFTENHMTFFMPHDDPDTFWPRTVELIEEYITGEVEENRFQDVMRHYYLGNGWKLYTIQDLLKMMSRLALTCSSTDAKEKTPDLISQYLTNREKQETSYQTEISARKFAEKCVKDGELFAIRWFPAESKATVRWLQRDETTFYTDDMHLRERWQYYISSFIRVEPTEGIPRSRLQRTVLARNLPSGDTDSDDGNIPKPLSYEENLTISICLKSSKMIWEPGTSEYFIYDQSPKTKEQRERREKFTKALSNHREVELTKKFVYNPAWAKDLSPEEVQEQNSNFRKWMDEGTPPPPPTAEMELDALMG